MYGIVLHFKIPIIYPLMFRINFHRFIVTAEYRRSFHYHELAKIFQMKKKKKNPLHKTRKSSESKTRYFYRRMRFTLKSLARKLSKNISIPKMKKYRTH